MNVFLTSNPSHQNTPAIAAGFDLAS